MPNNSETLDLSVIIPFKDRSKMTLECVASLRKFGPQVKEILLVSNNSSDEEVEAIKKSISDYPEVKLLEYNHPFNYQKINNWAVKKSAGEFILFLNNDTMLVKESRGVIESMINKAKQPRVGMTGCLLLYGDEKTIQHAGVFLRPGLHGDHLYVGEFYKTALRSRGSKKYPYDISKSRPLTAVTGAVQLIERRKFDSVNGFDERFIICGGDVDLCVRLNKKGYQTWYLGGGYIIHKESQSRAFKPIPYSDFFFTYESYLSAYDLKVGDPFVPLITKAA